MAGDEETRFKGRLGGEQEWDGGDKGRRFADSKAKNALTLKLYHIRGMTNL